MYFIYLILILININNQHSVRILTYLGKITLFDSRYASRHFCICSSRQLLFCSESNIPDDVKSHHTTSNQTGFISIIIQNFDSALDMLVVCSDMHVLESPLTSVVVTKMQDFASKFPQNFRGWYPRTPTAGGVTPTHTHPQLGLWPDAGWRRKLGVGTQTLVPQLCSRGCTPETKTEVVMVTRCNVISPGCVAARIASGTLFTLRMMSLYDLSTVANIFASAGSCLWMSGALNMLSRYSQLRWHVNHWSYVKWSKVCVDLYSTSS